MMRLFSLYTFFVFSVVVCGCADKAGVGNGSDDSQIYSIYYSGSDGSNLTLVLNDSKRALNHVRVSPDGEWITFTRYNNVGKDDCANENPNNYILPGGQYLNTEIMISRLDGSGLKSVTGHKPFTMNANSYWTEDGGLVYVSTPKIGVAKIYHIIFDENMEVKETFEIPTPDYLNPVVDPHRVGDYIVFPAADKKSSKSGIYIMKYDGSQLKELSISYTNSSDFQQMNDPKISPDGKKVAFMRNVKKGLFWHTIVYDLETGIEKDISASIDPGNTLSFIDALPEWSPDQEYILTWYGHLTKDWKIENGLDLVKPDGNERKRIPLPEKGKIHYSQGSFFPKKIDNNTYGIIFSTQIMGANCK